MAMAMSMTSRGTERWTANDSPKTLSKADMPPKRVARNTSRKARGWWRRVAIIGNAGVRELSFCIVAIAGDSSTLRRMIAATTTVARLAMKGSRQPHVSWASSGIIRTGMNTTVASREPAADPQEIQLV